MKMGAFLSVAKGSCELPYFMEMKYFGAESKDQPPLVLVGKGENMVCVSSVLFFTPFCLK